MNLDLHSEKFRPEGGAIAQAMTKALGTPRLDNMSVLVRESVQNSWDARRRDRKSQTVEFDAKIERFSKSQLETLRNVVFSDCPGSHPLEAELKGEVRRLVLQDRGTVGLGGPVFMEPLKNEGQPRNFLRFFRLFGRDAEVGPAGGTYGYGKAVFFNASKASTIIVHTKSLEEDGTTEERLMGMSLWKPNQKNMETGRHWWGVNVSRHKGLVAPVVGKEAAKLASAIGFEGFGRDETGTSIMVLAPRLDVPRKEPVIPGSEKGEIELAAKCLAESMVIWFWPRMIGAVDKAGFLKFRVSVDGQDISLPDPRKVAPFSTYALALDNLIAHTQRKETVPPPHKVDEVRSERPSARLGWISLSRSPVRPRPDWSVSKLEGHVLAEQLSQPDGEAGRLHHVALMRDQGQVIRYLPGREYPDEAVEYAGVFVVDGDPASVNQAFAQAEPPSHDDWTPEYLQDDWFRRYVRIGLKEIKRKTESFAEMGHIVALGGAQDPLGALSSELGELITAIGSGAQPKSKTGGGGGGGGGGAGNTPGRSSTSGVEVTNEGTLELWEGVPAFAISFRLQMDGKKGPSELQANPRVLVAGGARETEAPIGAEEPKVLAWCGPEGRIVKKKTLKVKSKDSGDWRLIVSVPKETMVGVTVDWKDSDDKAEIGDDR